MHILPFRLKFASSLVQSFGSQEGSLAFFWMIDSHIASLLGTSAGLSLCLISTKNIKIYLFITKYVLSDQFVGVVVQLLHCSVKTALGHVHHEPVLSAGGPGHPGRKINLS